MPISFTMRVSVPADVLRQELDKECVFLNINNGCYFGLDEVGTRMWQLLTTSESIQAAYDALRAEYDVDAEVLRRDLEAFVEKLRLHGLVEVTGA